MHNIYDLMSEKEFQQLIRDIAFTEGVQVILAIPGVWELVQEEYNNEALDRWKKELPWTWEEDEEHGSAKWTQNEIIVVLRPSDKPAEKVNRVNVKYELFDVGFDESYEPIFQGEDLSPTPLHEPLSLYTVETLLTFLCCRKGDVEEDYFKDHTERQLRWRDERAEEVGLYRSDLEELLATAK